MLKKLKNLSHNFIKTIFSYCLTHLILNVTGCNFFFTKLASGCLINRWLGSMNKKCLKIILLTKEHEPLKATIDSQKMWQEWFKHFIATDDFFEPTLTQPMTSSCCRILLGNVFRSFGLAKGNSMVKWTLSSGVTLNLLRANDQRLSTARKSDSSLSWGTFKLGLVAMKKLFQKRLVEKNLKPQFDNLHCQTVQSVRNIGF